MSYLVLFFLSSTMLNTAQSKTTIMRITTKVANTATTTMRLSLSLLLLLSAPTVDNGTILDTE